MRTLQGNPALGMRWSCDSSVFSLAPGLGHMAACLRHLVGPEGLVVGVDAPGEIERAKRSLTLWNDTALNDTSIRLLEGNVSDLGEWHELQQTFVFISSQTMY